MIHKKSFLFFLFGFLIVILVITVKPASAQIESYISGKVVDHITGIPIEGAQVYIKGQIVNTITSTNGSFELRFQLTPPVVLSVEIQGYETKNIDILASQNNLIITLTKKKYRIAAFNVNLADLTDIPYLSSTADIDKIENKRFKYHPYLTAFESLESLPGIYKTQNSAITPLLFVNGFATNNMSRTRFLVDGVDTSIPIIGYTLGNIIGLSSIDTESIELLRGASSALFGPNAYSGIVSLKSKDPFDYPLLSAEVSSGITHSNNRKTAISPFYKVALRYAIPISALISIKANLDYSYFDKDWSNNDYETHRLNTESKVNLKYELDFDGLNLHGDENSFILSLNNQNREQSTFRVARTGIPEQYLNNESVKHLLTSISFHFKFTNLLNGNIGYKLGYGDTIYQGFNKYKIQNSAIHTVKAQLNYSDSYVRAYVKQTNTGDAWSFEYLANLLNQRMKPTSIWAQEYIFAYKSVLEGLDPAITGLIDTTNITDPTQLEQAIKNNNNTRLAAHLKARRVADNKNLDYNSEEFKSLVNEFKNKQISPDFSNSGAKIVDSSRDYHVDLFHKFKESRSGINILLGGNIVVHELRSDGILYNEKKISDTYQPIFNNNYNGFGQIKKSFYSDIINLSAIVNANKNDNFDFTLSNKFAAITKVKSHSIRFIYQTAFRNPDMRNQYFWFQSPTSIYVGNTESNLGSYGLHKDNVYDSNAVNKFLLSGGTFNSEGNPIGNNLELLNSNNLKLKYLKPESVQSFEIGYRGMYKNVLLVNISYSFNQYTDLFYIRSVYNTKPIIRNGQKLTFANNSVIGKFTLLQNANSLMNSQTFITSFKLQLSKKIQLYTHYNYAHATIEESIEDDNLFKNQYNVPKHRYHLGVLVEKILNRFNVNINYSYQSTFNWQSMYASGIVQENSIVNAVIISELPKYKAVVRVGANNILGDDYKTSVGYANIGRLYFISLSFKNLLK